MESRLKKKQRALPLFGLLLVTFGITDLNFDNPALNDNIKAYALILLGVILLIAHFIIKQRAKP